MKEESLTKKNEVVVAGRRTTPKHAPNDGEPPVKDLALGPKHTSVNTATKICTRRVPPMISLGLHLLQESLISTLSGTALAFEKPVHQIILPTTPVRRLIKCECCIRKSTIVLGNSGSQNRHGEFFPAIRPMVVEGKGCTRMSVNSDHTLHDNNRPVYLPLPLHHSLHSHTNALFINPSSISIGPRFIHG